MASSEDCVPIYKDLANVYGPETADITLASSRIQKLQDQFQRLYGKRPLLLARAPGRVNLIGEHIDYEGYSVLPMAIRPDTIVAVAKKPVHDGAAMLHIANINTDAFPECKFTADPTQEVNRANHMWGNYFICGYKGVFEYLKEKGQEWPEIASLDVMVDGIVPTGAGLSSSAAFVCSAAIAVMAAYGLNFAKTEVADFACRCERHIGTQSGGMDQAISILARPGVAKLIDFDPVRAHDVVLPPGGTFVIANSLTVSNKAETADVHYNMRVVECRLAAMVLALGLGWERERAVAVKVLREVEEDCARAAPKWGGGTGPIPAVKACLHESPYTAEELQQVLGSSLEDIFASSPTSLAVLRAARSFKLQQRACHVYAEALRVHDFRRVAASAQSGEAGAAEVLQQLGGLMNDSHGSCAQLYECSCPELEELVAKCRSAGALGSRLTGAGWGGCTVSLLKDEDVSSFIATLKEKFYASRVDSKQIAESSLDSCVFASKPSSGAAIFQFL